MLELSYEYKCPGGCGKVRGTGSIPDVVPTYCGECLERMAKERAPSGRTTKDILGRLEALKSMLQKGEPLSPGEIEEMGNLWTELARRASKT